MPNFATGLSALSAARAAIETAGQNLANANTPGYVRQRVNLESLRPTTFGGQKIGGGVGIRSIERITDELLTSRVRTQRQEVGRRQAGLDLLSEVETIFGEPSSSGISAQITNFFNRAAALSTAPSDPQARSALIGAGSVLAEQVRNVRSGLIDAASSVRTLIATDVADVNRLAETLADLNAQVIQSRGSDGPPSSLLDRRTQLLDELAQLVDLDIEPLSSGAVSVTVGGHALVANDQANRLATSIASDGFTEVRLSSSGSVVDIGGGRIRGLLDFERTGTGDRIASLDRLAKTLIGGFNALHATGIPGSGGFDALRAAYPIVDADDDGDFSDERLEAAGLPFSIESGNLVVTVIDTATLDVKRTTVAIDPQVDSTGDLVAALDAVDGIKATIDASGRLLVQSDAGKVFHFANIVDPNPDSQNVFGGKRAQFSSSTAEPFALTAGSTFTVDLGSGVPQTVTLNAASFADITAATADELAAAISSSLVGAEAINVDGRVVIRSTTQGSSSKIILADGAGSPLAALGITPGTDFGTDVGVAVKATGRYTGSDDVTFTFRPLSDGTIGATQGLQVSVIDSNGRSVAVLDVGQGYTPGEMIEVADGIKISFGPGDVSKNSNEFFNLPVTAESDSARVLEAFGIGAFFEGTDASTISVASDVSDDPSLLAVGRSQAFDANGNINVDNGNVARFLALRDGGNGDLGDRTFSEFYSDIIAQVGLETSSSELSLETQTSLLESVESRLEQIRGVSIDEELADLQRFQQAYQAAARYITAVNDVTQLLFNI